MTICRNLGKNSDKDIREGQQREKKTGEREGTRKAFELLLRGKERRADVVQKFTFVVSPKTRIRVEKAQPPDAHQQFMYFVLPLHTRGCEGVGEPNFNIRFWIVPYSRTMGRYEGREADSIESMKSERAKGQAEGRGR